MSQLPKYSVDRFLELREGVIAAFNTAALTAPKLDKAVAKTVTASLANLFRADDVIRDSILQTCMQYHGEKLSPTFIRMLASQFAGRQSELSVGSLNKFGVDIASEWIPVEVVSVQPAVWRGTQPGAELGLECLGGRPSGHVFPRKFPTSWLNFLAYRVGFSRRINYPDDPRLLLGLRFWAHMIACENLEALDFSDWDVDKHCKQHNREIIKLRMRFDTTDDVECPYGYEHECVACERTQRECIAAYLRSGQPNATAKA